MKKVLGAIPKFPRQPKFPKLPEIPDAPNAPSARIPGMPGGMPGGMAAKPPGGGPAAAGQVPGNVHAFPGEVIKRISAMIASRGQSDIGTAAYIERMMKKFPLDDYRDADGNIRCPVSKERRDQLKSTFGD